MRMLQAGALSFLVCLLAFAFPSWGQTADKRIPVPQDQPRRATTPVQSEADARTRINNWTVTLLSSTITGIHIRMAADLQTVLDDGDNLRLLPVLGSFLSE